MNKRDLGRMCLQNLFCHRGRTALTVLGVVVGCCAVIIMLSIGIGMKEAQEKMLSEMGDLTIITVMPTGKNKLTEQSIREIQAIQRVDAASPKLTAGGVSIRVTAGPNKRYISDTVELVGLYPEAIEKLGYQMMEGEIKAGKKFSVLIGQDFAYGFMDTKRPQGRNMVESWPDESGEIPAPYLNPMQTPLDLELPADGDSGKKAVQRLFVSGRLKTDYSKGWETSSGIVMGIQDMEKLLDEQRRLSGKLPGKKKEYPTALVKVKDIQDVEPVENLIQGMGYKTNSMESIRKPMEKEARQKQLMFGGLGAISLLVAALGIANTMMMAITERTREIGIMKSLGCYVRDVRSVFLLEAGCIGLLGGLFGSVLSGVISMIMNFVAMQSPGGGPAESMGGAMMDTAGVAGSPVSVIPPWLVLFALLFSVLIGVASGYYPANKAVQIPALEAIKHD